jgi:hypothetical protein
MPTKEQLLNEYLLAAMDSGKVRMKSPKAGRGGEALMTAAENVLPFVSAAKSALEGDYRNAMIQAGLDVALPPAVKSAAALGGKFLAPALAGAIKAYHGSPHKFDKFDISKIGTGEGAQAYGHGLYFAESPKVAEEYQKKLSGDQVLFKGSPLPESTDDALNPKAFMARWALGNKMSGDALIKHWTDLVNESKAAAKEKAPDWQQKISAKQLEQRKQLLREAKKYKPEDYSVMPQGNLYETNLRWPGAREAADPLGPQHFLDYDKPLSEQSKFVQDALAKIGYSVDKSKVSEYDDALLSALFGKDVLVPKEPFNPSGERIINRLTNTFGDKVAASERLGGAGIPGIRYKDAGSRSNFRVQTSYKGEPYGEPVSFMTEQQALNYAKEQQEKGFGADVMPGTSNYVLFSDELAEILKRNDEQLKASKVQSPDFVIPQSKIQSVKENILKNYGRYGAQRVERAADEIPNLGNLYTEQALLRAFSGDNAKALMTIDPKNFEQYAHRLSDSKEGVIDTLKKLVGGFEDVPFLQINKEEYGLPLIPFISGHEGRHRSRAMSELGENASLVQLLPRAELREPFPRRSQEEYVNALKEELALMDNMVLPEREALLPQRPAIKLPDIYAKGGSATKSVKKRSKNG